MKEIIKLTYGPLHRISWSIVVGWIIFACSSGYSGIIILFLFEFKSSKQADSRRFSQHVPIMERIYTTQSADLLRLLGPFRFFKRLLRL